MLNKYVWEKMRLILLLVLSASIYSSCVYQTIMYCSDFELLSLLLQAI